MDHKDAQFIIETGLLQFLNYIKGGNRERFEKAESEVNQAIGTADSMRIKADLYDNHETYLINEIKTMRNEKEGLDKSAFEYAIKDNELTGRIKDYEFMLMKLQGGPQKLNTDIGEL